MILNLLILNCLIIFSLLLIKSYNIRRLRILSLSGAFILFIYSCSMWIVFQNDIGFFQYFFEVNWIFFFNIQYAVGVDGLSLFFVILSTFLIPFCILISWTSIIYRLKEYFLLFFFYRVTSYKCFLCFRYIFILYFLWSDINSYVLSDRRMGFTYWACLSFISIFFLYFDWFFIYAFRYFMYLFIYRKYRLLYFN